MLKLIGCGDLFIAHRLPENKYKGFKEISNLIKQHEFRFGNLETTIHYNEGYPSLFPGGGYAVSTPITLNDLKLYGFNVFNIANNHMMDFSHKGLEATIKYLRDFGMVVAGAGMNLAEACKPRYVECSEGRVALISITSSFHDSDAAGNQSIDMLGRPGVNPLRHTEVFQITEPLYTAVKEIADTTGINSNIRWGIENGYIIEENFLKLKNLSFQIGEENLMISEPLEKDVKRTIMGIQEARYQSDCIVVSIHAHQFKGVDSVPDDFVIKFCHKCIEAGADVILGHGSHIVRGIEKYKNGIIFYGLGDFILQNEQVEYLPADFYEKYNVPFELYGTVGHAMDTRSHGGRRGLISNPDAWRSFMVSIDFEHGIKGIKLYPIELQLYGSKGEKGWPILSKSADILKKLRKLSNDFNTKIDIEKNIGIINMN
ncbi:MAG: CapA family protein [Lachnospiraceae bacterium]|nr:CapA family protein [Lachnospiraceae bacterium]